MHQRVNGANKSSLRSASKSKAKAEIDSSDSQNESSSEREGASEAQKTTKPKEGTTLKKVAIRSATATALMILFYAILQAGHFYCILFIILIQTELYRELVNVRYVAAKEKKMPFFRSIQWAWFFVPMVFVYGESFHKFCSEHKQLKYVTTITQHTDNISFIMYCFLFVISVLTLKQGMVKFQLSQFMWSIVTVCIVVFQLKFLAVNILNGLFWFLFPIATVVTNDVSAYFCGITFGKRFIKAPLIAMSPNKTWEGFFGAAVFTMIFSFYFPLLLAKSSWYICPAEVISIRPFPPAISCEPNPIFLETVMDLPFIGGQVTLLPIQIHGLFYGLFASLVAPFGGFLASAIKRAYNLKDFDSFFPGHGGVMDRADCQLVMLGFSVVHYYAFVAPKAPSIDKMLFLASLMTVENQQKLIQELIKQISG